MPQDTPSRHHRVDVLLLIAGLAIVALLLLAALSRR